MNRYAAAQPVSNTAWKSIVPSAATRKNIMAASAAVTISGAASSSRENLPPLRPYHSTAPSAEQTSPGITLYRNKSAAMLKNPDVK